MALLLVLCFHQVHGAGLLTVDDLDYLFGPNGCIEGTAFLLILFITFVCLVQTASLCCVSFILPYVIILKWILLNVM
jgi:hypothetical protein